MAYNIPEKYQDLTPAPQLDKKTLNKMVWLSCFLQASFNYERMQACGWLWGMLPGLQKIHTNKEDLKASMAHNLDFLNTHPFLVTFVMGIVLSLEQNKADTATIRSVRISAAGPLGGIGDALFWLTLVPITAGLTANMAMEGQIIGAVLFLIIFNAVQFAVRFGLMYWSYGLGTKAVTLLTSSAKEFTRAASILGIFVVGGLIANYGGTSLRIVVGDPAINIQGLLDGVLPKLIPLLITLGIYVLIKKGWTPVKCIILILVVGILGCAFGIWTGDSKAMDADGNTIPGGYTPLVEWKWNAVDFTGNRIHICNNILYSPDIGVYEDTPKTATSDRWVSLPTETMQLLRQYRAWQNAERLRLGEYYREQGFLFAQDDGKPMHPDSITDWLSKFSRRHDLPHINPHAFRHTMASMLYFSGVDSVSISKRLGHAQVSTTANIYAHVMESADRKNADILADVFLKKA